MSVPLIISGVTYNYPVTNDQSWGEAATNWAIAVTDVIDILIVDGDLAPPNSPVTVINNQATDEDVVGLAFDSTNVRAAKIIYWIYRLQGATEKMESGDLEVRYKTNTNTWTISQNYSGDDSGVTLAIDPVTGQITYTSTDLMDIGIYIGQMTYRAWALPA